MSSEDAVFIAAPVISHRFFVEFMSPTNTSLTRQLLKVQVDLINMKLLAQFRQPATDDGFLQSIVALCNTKDYRVKICHLYADGNIASTFVLTGCNTVSHTYALDYADNTPATHNLEIAFDEITPPN